MIAPYRGLVSRAYQRAIESIDMDSSLRRSLKSHERVPRFIDNLSDEFTKLAAHRLKVGKALPADRHLESLVRDFTEMFVHGIKTKADMAYESEIKASMRKQMEDNRRDLENTIEGNASGDYADVLKDGGVKTLDSRDNYGEEKNGATAR
jgi:hypothetical protein